MPDFREVKKARKILGLDKDASVGEIKNAYKKLALSYHPDRCKDENKKECEEMFKKVNRAYDVIIRYTAGPDKEFYEHLKRFYDGWWGDLDL